MMSDEIHHEIPPHVAESLARLTPRQVELLEQLLSALSSLGVLCKLTIYIVAGVFGAIIMLSHAIDATKRLIVWK